MDKRFEILNSLPVYGPMYVSIPENNYHLYSEGLPIRFFKSDGTDWVANFQTSYTNFTVVFSFKKSIHILIIARGNCYMINPDSAIPLTIIYGEYSNAIQIPDDRIIAWNDACITIISPDGSYWTSERISWDGFENIIVDENIITGQYSEYPPYSDDMEWLDFSLNIDTKETAGLPKWYGNNFTPQASKPWWKIW